MYGNPTHIAVNFKRQPGIKASMEGLVRWIQGKRFIITSTRHLIGFLVGQPKYPYPPLIRIGCCLIVLISGLPKNISANLFCALLNCLCKKGQRLVIYRVVATMNSHLNGKLLRSWKSIFIKSKEKKMKVCRSSNTMLCAAFHGQTIYQDFPYFLLRSSYISNI